MQDNARHRGRITWAGGSHKSNRRQKPQGDSGQQITKEHSLQDGCKRVTELRAAYTESRTERFKALDFIQDTNFPSRQIYVSFP